MSSVKFHVRYRYVTPGKHAGTSASTSGTVKSQSETLVMQELRKKHPGKEIELTELEWK